MRQLIATAVLAASLLVAPTAIHARTLTVDCNGGQFTTIQAAVDAAATLDTIRVAPCVYEEHVSVVDKALVFRGSGHDVTELRWAGSGAAMQIKMPPTGRFQIADLRITRVPSTERALSWDEYGITLHNCVVTGGAGGGLHYGAAIVDGCNMTSLGVCGAVRTTTVTDSRIGSLSLGWIDYVGGEGLMSTRSTYGSVSIACLAGGHCVGDSIGQVEVPGGMDCGSYFRAEDSTIDMLLGSRSPEILLDRCVTGDITCTYIWEDDFVPLSLRYCLVRGSLSVEPEWGTRTRVSGAPSAGRDFYGLRLLHNTVLGDLLYPLDVLYGWPADARWVRDNIVMGQTEIYGGSLLVISHNDFVGGVEVTAPGDSVFANFSDDPLFCNPTAGNYALQDCSPCLGASHDGGDVGALGVGCICQAVGVESPSWGAIKAMFR
jgi:hypothetical protein